MTRRVFNLIVRIGLFAVILALGTMTALTIGETPGLALADLSDAAVQAIATSARSEVLYTALAGGVQPAGLYRSEDGGQTWQVVGSGPGAAIASLTIDPDHSQILYAGTAGGPVGVTNNIWRSEDGGQSWRNFSLPLPASPARLVPAVTAMAVDPTQPERLYVGTAGQGVYRFDLGRVGYELVGGLTLATAHVKELVVSNDGRLYALTNEGLYVTSGDSWRRLDTVPETPISLAVAPGNPQTLYAGGPSMGAYRSDDGGQSWMSISAGLGLTPGAALRVTALAVDKESDRHLLAATAYGLGSQLAPGSLYESYDGGNNWRKVADLDSLVHELTLDQRITHAATATGLKRYGEGVEAGEAKAAPPLQQLTNPTGIQLLVLSLTVGLAGLVLVGRLEWLLKRLRGTS